MTNCVPAKVHGNTNVALPLTRSTVSLKGMPCTSTNSTEPVGEGLPPCAGRTVTPYDTDCPMLIVLADCCKVTLAATAGGATTTKKASKGEVSSAVIAS